MGFWFYSDGFVLQQLLGKEEKKKKKKAANIPSAAFIGCQRGLQKRPGKVDLTRSKTKQLQVSGNAKKKTQKKQNLVLFLLTGHQMDTHGVCMSASKTPTVFFSVSVSLGRPKEASPAVV